jgi:hypothetical protein
MKVLGDGLARLPADRHQSLLTSLPDAADITHFIFTF